MTEILDAIKLAQISGYTCIIFHSDKTEDTTISDLTVISICDQIKSVYTLRTGKTWKYNQLIRIEEELEK